MYLKAIVTTPQPQNRQHLLFNRDYAHSVIYTLTSIESYLNFILKDNKLSEAETIRNQFGRLKALEFTDYHQLTNQQLEDILANTRFKSPNFRLIFQNCFFLILSFRCLFLILYTAPHTSTAYQSMKAVPKLGYFRIILKIKR
jgi:hypothetical protein